MCIQVKAPWRTVQKVLKASQARVLDDAATESLRAAAQAWQNHFFTWGGDERSRPKSQSKNPTQFDAKTWKENHRKID